MIITKEQQEAWISNYVKEKHTSDECIGFIDGVEKIMEIINKDSDLTISNIKKETLSSFIKEVKEEFKDQNWDYLDFIAERILERNKNH